MLKRLDFVYWSHSVLIINREALAWTRFIQPPLRHFPIQAIEAERRGKYRVTSTRRDGDDISTAPAAVVLHHGLARLNLEMRFPPFVPAMIARSSVQYVDHKIAPPVSGYLISSRADGSEKIASA
jgi:hypothetical protein